MEKKHKKGHLPIWAQLLLIILCGVIASVGAYYLTQKKIAATREAQKPRYTVTFAYQNGSPIATRQVKEGCGTFPPDIETNGVFQGWNGAFNEVMADIEVHPMCYELNGDENLFCFNAVYAQEGTDFAFDLRLSGNVNISKAQIEIEFDSEVMDYVQATPCEYCKVEESGEGLLLLEVDSKEPITVETVLASLTFHALKKDVYSTQINLRCISGALSVDGKEISVPVTTINNKIYYLQEVSQ